MRPPHLFFPLRSPAWLKLKPKLTLEVMVTSGSAKRIAWGDWGEAVMLEVAYTHPRSAEPVHIRQAVRIARDQPFELRIGEHAQIICWGVTPSGMLRHPLFARWSTTEVGRLMQVIIDPKKSRLSRRPAAGGK